MTQLGPAVPPLVAVAHGSRDPRSAATVMRLLEVVRVAAPRLDVRAAFLDLSAPRLHDVLGALHEQERRSAIVVPMLLGSAYHARVDIPGAVCRAGARFPRLQLRVADVLGPDPRLETVALQRLAEAGARPDDGGLGVVLAAAGSSHAPANAAVRAVARRWAPSTGWRANTAAFAAAATPDVPTALAALRARGARRFAIGSWFLAPGLLPDRIGDAARRSCAEPLVAAPLGAHPLLAQVLLDRYREAAAAPDSAATLRYA
ncbi:MAG: sirohydrochlorin chelatase [Sciscionella sp.]